MNNKEYIDKIELILNTSDKYITKKEKDMIIDYVNYFKSKNNVIEDKNIELVIEIKRLNNIINELSEKNRNLIEDNMRLRKELNLHSGKLYISDIEVKNVF